MGEVAEGRTLQYTVLGDAPSQAVENKHRHSDKLLRNLHTPGETKV